ncbi:MAG TPA: 50S ribosomal protein L10, partial [Ignavibacteria bacterium]|nr:50S ribosomal protein L10 [Ignavibacteria bacterium]
MKTTQIPEKKINVVKELSDLIKNKKTILIASIKNLPASQFQEIGKKLRSNVVIKVPKKNLIFRAIDESKNEKVKEVKEQIKESTAILFSDLDSFELASELIENKSPAGAKAGQEAPEDIEVQEGPTDLIPGPAISELGALGIQIQIEKGKIHIKNSKIIVKKGEKISANAAGIMNKLDIKPFSVGFIPLVAFDIKEGKLYLNIKIDKEETLKELKESFSKALAFAVEISYFSDDSIKFLIGKAGSHEKVLEKIIGTEKTLTPNQVGLKEDASSEESKEEVSKKKEEISNKEDKKD